MSSRMMVYHTWTSQCVVGVDEDSGIMGVGKDSVHDAWVSVISFHGMALGFHLELTYSSLEC